MRIVIVGAGAVGSYLAARLSSEGLDVVVIESDERHAAKLQESVDALVEDPWKVLPCSPDPAGCRVTFSDPDYETFRRDTVYYVRAIEAPSQVVDYDGVTCLDAPWDEDCLGEVEERAWSSPIFVDWAD